MNRRLRPLTLFLGLALVGCASQARYGEMMQSWVGKSEADLVLAWGPPHRTHQLNNRTYYSYGMNRLESYNGPGFMAGSSGQTFWGLMLGGSTKIESRHCDSVFELERQTVTRVSFRGDDCLL